MPEIQTIRMSLDVTPEMKAAIEELARKGGRTQAEVLRNAVGLLKVVKEINPNGPVIVLDQEGHKTKIIV